MLNYVRITGCYLFLFIFVAMWSIYCLYIKDYKFFIYTIILFFSLCFYVNKRMNIL